MAFAGERGGVFTPTTPTRTTCHSSDAEMLVFALEAASVALSFVPGQWAQGGGDGSRMSRLGHTQMTI